MKRPLVPFFFGIVSAFISSECFPASKTPQVGTTYDSMISFSFYMEADGKILDAEKELKDAKNIAEVKREDYEGYLTSAKAAEGAVSDFLLKGSEFEKLVADLDVQAAEWAVTQAKLWQEISAEHNLGKNGNPENSGKMKALSYDYWNAAYQALLFQKQSDEKWIEFLNFRVGKEKNMEKLRAESKFDLRHSKSSRYLTLHNLISLRKKIEGLASTKELFK